MNGAYPYYDKQGNPVYLDINKGGDLERFAELWDPEYRSVAMTTVGNVLVSTVFLPINHNLEGDGDPVIFETMVFGYDSRNWLLRLWTRIWRRDYGGRYSEYQWRYTRQGYAETGHRLIVEAVQERRLRLDTLPRVVNDEVLGDIEDECFS